MVRVNRALGIAPTFARFALCWIQAVWPVEWNTRPPQSDQRLSDDAGAVRSGNEKPLSNLHQLVAGNKRLDGTGADCPAG